MKAIDIANAFIVLHGESGYLTNTKLNKLVYFAYAEELHKGRKLFDDRIECGLSGPVIHSVYRTFLVNDRGPIRRPTKAVMVQEAFQIARNTWNTYGFMSAYDLMEFACRPHSAWAIASVKKVSHVPYSVPVTDEMILASGDGKDRPRREGTLSEAIDESLVGLRGVLKKLAGVPAPKDHMKTKSSHQQHSSKLAR